MARQVNLFQDSIMKDMPHPIYEGRSITIANVGTHRMFVGNRLVVPGAEWVMSLDTEDSVYRVPEIRFEKDEWRDFKKLTEIQLPILLIKKGKMATVQYIID